ncbi:MAG: PAS domain S-box protein [Candidatus Krumholzibacteria bacterium]|nr:PAS domain S-box protein [Candidatus Krumholzibacteria bacterium]
MPGGSVGSEGDSRPAGEKEGFREAAETFPLAIFECDAEGRITFANSSAFDYYGYAREDLERGICMFDAIAPSDRSRAMKTLRNLVAGERSPGNEYVALRKDGSTFPVIIYVSPIVRDGRIVGTRGIVIDISVRKRSQEALRESEERFRSIIEKGPGLFYEHSCEHVFTYLSPQVERILGFKPGEVLMRWTDLASDHPVNKRAIELTRRAIETGERQPPYEVELIARDGRRVWLEVDEAPVVLDGKTVTIVGAAQDVTERRLVQQELQKLSAIVHGTSECVILTSPDGMMIFLNEAGGRMLGISPGDIHDFRIEDVMPPAHKDLMRSKIIPALLKRERWEGDLQYRNVLTGQLIDVHTLAFTIRDQASGAPLHFANVSRDITERKRASDVLRERQAKLDSLFRAAPVGIGIVAEHIIVEVNDRICEMTGYSKEELIGTSARMLYATDQEFDFIRHEKDRQITLQGSGSVETRWRRKDGAMIDILLSSAPLVAGDPWRGVTFTALDITERRLGEDALRTSEKRYRQLIEMLQEGIWTIDSDARTTFVNPRLAEMLGYTVEEMLGKHLFSFMDDRWAEECKRLLDRRLRGIEEEHDFEFIRKDGRRIFVRIKTAPIADENGVIVGAIAGVEDQTERKRSEDERRLFEARLRESQKLESLGILAGGVAHDFNNILLAIQGNLEFAVASLPPEAPARESLSEVERAAKRAADLCRQLLAYSGKGRFAIGSLNLSRAIEETARMLAVSISKKAELRLDLASDIPLVEADATQIQQVIMNLIVNASEALGEENGVIAVSAGTMECDRACLDGMINGERLPEGRYVFFEVADTGCGMDEETQRKICDPFFTTKSAGRGLGLPVILGVMRGHGGAIRIRSERGKGTMFRLVFPVSTSTVEQIDESPAPVADWRGSGTMLLVDDEEMVRAVAKRMLEQLGFSVLLATNGAEAIEIFRASLGTIACVVLDLTMPRMDGIETLAALRAISSDVKVILSSGYSEHEISKRFAGKGFSGFIEKPYRISELGDRLRNVLGARADGDGEE